MVTTLYCSDWQQVHPPLGMSKGTLKFSGAAGACVRSLFLSFSLSGLYMSPLHNYTEAMLFNIISCQDYS